MEAAGLCHSDLSVVDGNRVRPVPMLLGHEAAGVVEQLGPGDSDLRPGRRVVMTFLPRCGHCPACATDGLTPCEPGSAANTAGTLLSGAIRLTRDGQPVHHHLGISGFASHAVVDRRSVVPVDSDVPPSVAALLGCAVLTGGGAVLNVGRPRPGQRVIEAAGHPDALATAIQLTAPGGRTITVGLPPPDARLTVSPLGLVAEGRSLIGSYLGSAVPARDIPRFVDLWRSGRLPVEQLVSSTITLDELNEGLDRLADGAAVRQLITLPG